MNLNTAMKKAAGRLIVVQERRTIDPRKLQSPTLPLFYMILKHTVKGIHVKRRASVDLLLGIVDRVLSIVILIQSGYQNVTNLLRASKLPQDLHYLKA